MTDRSIVIKLKADIADFKKGMGEAAGSAKGAKEELEKATSKSQAWGRAAAEHSTAIIGVGVALEEFARRGINRSADFAQAMSTVAATGDDARQNIEALTQAALQFGADTAYNAIECAEAISELAKAGLSASDILGGALQGSLDLAASEMMSIGEAASITATAIQQFGLDSRQAVWVSDLLAAGAGKALGSAHDLGEALGNVGVMANMMGVDINSTIGTLAAFAQYGIIGAEAGTAMKSMLMALIDPTNKAQGVLNELGIELENEQGQFIGMTALAGELSTKMSGLTEIERNHAMAVIFGSYAVRAAGVLFNEGADGIANWINEVNDWGFAADAAATKMDNLKGDLEQLGGTFETIIIQSGSGLNGALRGIVQTADDLLSTFGKLPTPVLSTGLAISGLAGIALIGIGTMGKLAHSINEIKEAELLTEAATGKLATALQGIGKVAGVVGAVLATAFVAGKVVDGINQSGKDMPTFGGLLNHTQAYVQTLEAASTAQEKAAATTDTLNGMFQVHLGRIDGTTSGLNEFARMSYNATHGFEGLLNSFTGLYSVSQKEQFEEHLATVDKTLSDLVNRGYAEQAATLFTELHDSMAFNGWSDSEIQSYFGGYTEAVEAAGIATDALKLKVALASPELELPAIEDATTRLAAFGEKGEKVFDSLTEMGLAGNEIDLLMQRFGLNAEKVLTSFSGTLAQTAANISNHSNAWDEARGKAEKPPSMDSWLREMDKQVAAYEKYQGNMDTLSKRIRDELPADMQVAAEGMLQAFASSPDQIAMLVGSTEEQFAAMVDKFARSGEGSGNQWAVDFATELLAVAPQIADEFANALVNALSGEDVQIIPDVDTTNVETAAEEVQSRFSDIDAEIIIETQLGSGEIDKALYDVKLKIDNTEGTVKILGDNGRILETIKNAKIEVDRTTGTMSVTGDDKKGREVVRQFKGDIDTTTSSLIVDADVSRARSTISNYAASIPPITIPVNVQMSSSGMAAINSAGIRTRATGGPLQGFPTGGFLPGQPPADPMQDNILAVDPTGVPVAMVRSREFVVQEPSAQYYGPLMWAINAMRIPREYLAALLSGGLPGRATGGIAGKSVAQLAAEVIKGNYGNGQARKDALGSQYAAVQALVNQQLLGNKSSSTPANPGGGGAAAPSGPSAAEIAAAEAAKRAAEEAARKAEEARKKAEAEAKARQKEADTLRLQIQRGQVIEQGSSSLSGAQSLADRLRAMGANDSLGLSSSVSNWLRDVASQQEATFTGLFKQVEALDKKLKDARDKVAELATIKASASSAIAQGWRLADAAQASVNTVTKTANNGNSSFTYSQDISTPATGASMLAKAEQFAARVQTFAGKLSQLQSKGFTGAILAEIAQMGVEAGIPAADALLALGSGEVSRFNSAYESIETWSDKAGEYVTKGFYNGGIAAAEGLVAGLESQKAALQKAIEAAALTMQDALKKALGIASPSKVFRQLGKFTGEGLVLGMNDMRDAVAYSAANLVAVPPAVVANNQMSAGAGNAGGPVININIDNPVNEPSSVTMNRALSAVGYMGI